MPGTGEPGRGFRGIEMMMVGIGPVLFGVPLGRFGDQFAVAVAPLDVGEHDRRQLARPVNVLAAPIDDALDLQILEHLLQPDPVAALDVEGLRDLALADLAGRFGDEGDDLFAGGKPGSGGFCAFSQRSKLGESIRSCRMRRTRRLACPGPVAGPCARDMPKAKKKAPLVGA